MDIGMLWFDDNPAVCIADKVAKAASYYASKYGRRPNICFVHPGIITREVRDTVGGIVLQTDPRILPNHFWLGIQKSSSLS